MMLWVHFSDRQSVSQLCVCISQMLNDQLKIKFSVLRAYYEKLDCDADNLIAVLHAKYAQHFMLCHSDVNSL